MRFAFVTPEFVTEYGTGGGLGNYLNKVARVLVSGGHFVEVFVPSDREPAVLDHLGVRVQRVSVRERPGWAHWGEKLVRVRGARKYAAAFSIETTAWSLARAFERRDRESPFDAVQSTDFLASGMYVRPRKGRPHLVRCSCAAELYADADPEDGENLRRTRARYELKAVRRAEVAYAPSEFAARYYRARLRREVYVVRPPAVIETTAADGAEIRGLPPRFLFHFGQLRKRKGTEWLIRSLINAWETEPSLTVVFAGIIRDHVVKEFLENVELCRGRAIWLGELPKSQIYSALQRSVGAVLPSLVDNLPNSVIESLSHGIPVVGTRGASVDELVQDGHTGELADAGDVEGLSRAMVRVWRGQSAAKPGFVWDSEIARALRPACAVESLLSLVRAASGRCAPQPIITTEACLPKAK